MKEVVAFFARNLEADEAEPFSGHYGLLAFTTVHRRSKRHESPPKLGLLFLVGQFVSERFGGPCQPYAAAREPGRSRGTTLSRRHRHLFRFRVLSEISG